ncbi:MAG TPA: pseudouridine synthase [Polyangiaceae bacterium]|nr:pseudouridine synthase [Polyangiaceae bacterium]
MKRYFATAVDLTLGHVLARANEFDAAVAEGRVFIGKRRAFSVWEPLVAGDEIVVHPPTAVPEGVVVLSSAEGLHAVAKPVGLSTEPDRRGGTSLVARAAELLGVPPKSLHAATRLDAAVSGIVVVAEGPDAAKLVESLKRSGRLRRRYVAIAAGAPSPSDGTWSVPIGTGPRGRPVANGKDARPATTEYRTAWSGVASGRTITALVLEPVTGRSHQLRIHAAEAGAPLYGDAQRGGPTRFVSNDGAVTAISRVLLHAGRIRARLPSGAWSVTFPPPGDFSSFLVSVGGDPAVVAAALDEPFLDGRAPA